MNPRAILIGKVATLCLLAMLGSNAFSQTSPTPKDLAGVRHLGPGQIGDTNATFAIGLSTDDGVTFVSTAQSTQSHKVIGVVRAEAGHIGTKADIFFVDRVNGVFMMRNAAGAFVPWNGRVAELVPFVDDATLTSNHTVDFTGPLVAGEHRLFIGYQPADGVLRYTNIANIVTITEKSARDLAMDAFTANISSQIVQSNCIACHVIGGAAQGQSIHTFVPSSNASHLTINFTQFENLLKARGRTFILAKVRGENAHVGGTVLISGSAEYQNLNAFLQLLEKL